ncbi:glycosyltransferase [Egbenema bharatensis]|uniref:glycosyltransferase n=1 Tax=Egbenema bharatensis TaxID=3463334 RepID=UPI003A835D1F
MLYIHSTNRSPTQKPIRALHVLGQMSEGGIEAWLLQLVRRFHPDRIQMDFLVETNRTCPPCPYEDELRARGSQIFVYPHTRNPWLYNQRIQQVLHDFGPYDVVHSHDNFIGSVMRSAYWAGVPVRIAHSHTDLFAMQTLFKTQASLQRRLAFQLFSSLNRRWIHQYATVGFGCSQNAAASLFGSSWGIDQRWQILYCGIDLAPFQTRPDPVCVRAELGIPGDRFVIGHVGRLATAKNHAFLVNVFAAVLQKQPNTHLLLVGEGDLQSSIQQQVARMGLVDHVTFTGFRSDVPHLMLGAMDAFVFPSLFEGLGLALVEAQAAGLPCLFSDVIPAEADIVHPLIHRLSLEKSPFEWAEALLALQRAHPAISPTDALDRVTASPFNLERSLQQIATLYQTEYARSTLQRADQDLRKIPQQAQSTYGS